MIYAGIGSRRTPSHVRELMRSLGMHFALNGWTLRSGGASGADAAFEYGCDKAKGEKEIYLPWQEFRSNPSPFFNVTESAINMARKYHSSWNSLTDKAKKLHGRNSYQVLGYYLIDPCDLIICYAGDCCETHADRSISTGGTGTAISIGDNHKIPIINLARKDSIERLEQYL